jgi:hypothetical protein
MWSKTLQAVKPLRTMSYTLIRWRVVCLICRSEKPRPSNKAQMRTYCHSSNVSFLCPSDVLPGLYLCNGYKEVCFSFLPLHFCPLYQVVSDGKPQFLTCCWTVELPSHCILSIHFSCSFNSFPQCEKYCTTHKQWRLTNSLATLNSAQVVP